MTNTSHPNLTTVPTLSHLTVGQPTWIAPSLGPNANKPVAAIVQKIEVRADMATTPSSVALVTLREVGDGYQHVLSSEKTFVHKSDAMYEASDMILREIESMQRDREKMMRAADEQADEERRENGVAQLQEKLTTYKFRDELGHPLENCTDYQELVALAGGAV